MPCQLFMCLYDIYVSLKAILLLILYILTSSNYFFWNTAASKQCFIAQLSIFSFQSIHFVSEMVDLPAKKKKRQSGLPMSSRNAVGLLNELRTGVEFTLVAQTGPVHCPVFTMAVTVRNRNIQLFTLRFQWESDKFTEAWHGTSMDTSYEWTSYKVLFLSIFWLFWGYEDLCWCPVLRSTQLH